MANKTIWTAEIDELMRRHYPHHPNKELVAIIGLKVKQLQRRAHMLGLVKLKPFAAPVALAPAGTDPDQFIRDNFDTMTNRQLAAALGQSIQNIRYRCYAMGLLRMQLEYWTDEQVEFLKANYQVMGDRELADIFNGRWPKQKSWTLKHIEKKRMYLKLKRTAGELKQIHSRNIELGYWAVGAKNSWITRGAYQEGEIRMWYLQSGRRVPFVKVNGKFVHWARWAWEQANGPIAPGYNIVFKDNDPNNRQIDNLEMITDAELSKKNSQISSVNLSDSYVAGLLTHGQPDLRDTIRQMPALLDLKRQQLILDRQIKQHDNGRR